MAAQVTIAQIIVWLAAAGAFLSIVAVGLPFLRRDQRSARVKELGRRREELSRQQIEGLAAKNPLRERRRSAKAEVMKKILEQLKLTDVLSSKGIKQQLSQAGFRSQTAVVSYVFARLAVAGGAGVLTFLFVVLWRELDYPFAVKMLFVAIGAVAGFYLPRILVINYAQKRQQEMTKAFPDALDLMLICVESGLTVEAAFDRVTEEIGESSPVLAQELGLTTAELAYLGDRRRAFENFAERTGLPAAKSLATTLIQSEKYGTPVGMALKVLSQEKRQERMSAAEKKAAALPAKLTVPMIVFFLPVLFLVVIGPAIIQIMNL